MKLRCHASRLFLWSFFLSTRIVLMVSGFCCLSTSSRDGRRLPLSETTRRSKKSSNHNNRGNIVALAQFLKASVVEKSSTVLTRRAAAISSSSSTTTSTTTLVPNAHKALECRSSALSLIRYRSTRGKIIQSQANQEQQHDDYLSSLPTIALEKEFQSNSQPRRRKRPSKTVSRTCTPEPDKRRRKGDVQSSSPRIEEPKHRSTVSAETCASTEQKTPPNTRAQQQQRTHGADLPYESALAALQAYHDIHGDLVMPRRFVVPLDDDDDDEDSRYPVEWRGLPLSSCVYTMKWWQTHVKQRPQRVAQLNALGFVWERLQPEWNLVLEALVTYAQLYGDCLVPIKFVVPHGNDDRSPWPKATWGIPLGSCAHRIRSRDDFLRGHDLYVAASRREQLNGLGFVWDVSEERFQKFYRVLFHYAQLEREKQSKNAGSSSGSSRVGSVSISAEAVQPLRVPSTFVVPSGDNTDWGAHPEFWNYPLGAKCTAVRQKQLYIKGKPERMRRLAELGFYWNSGNADLGWLHVVHAAAIFSRMNQRKLHVPYHFVVPAPPSTNNNDNDDCSRHNNEDSNIDLEEWPWPQHLWGLPLGQRLKDVRTKDAYLKGKHGPKRRQQLDTLGFDWKPKRGRPPKIRAF